MKAIDRMARQKPEYQQEPGNDFRAAIWQAGAITPLQLFRIGAWKSAKGLASLSLNSEEQIANTTAAALAAIEPYRNVDVLSDDVDWEDWERVASTAIGCARNKTGLLGLSGVGYAMATAQLACLAPDAFPVMDRWTNLAIFGRGLGQRWQHAAVYSIFTQRLAEIRPQVGENITTIHQLDQAVMNDIMGCTHRRDQCDHVKFSAIPLP